MTERVPQITTLIAGLTRTMQVEGQSNPQPSGLFVPVSADVEVEVEDEVGLRSCVWRAALSEFLTARGSCDALHENSHILSTDTGLTSSHSTLLILFMQETSRDTILALSRDCWQFPQQTLTT